LYKQSRRSIPRTPCVATLIAVAALVAGGCGGSGGGVAAPQIGAARTFGLAGFQPSGVVAPGRRTTITFTVQQPSGEPLTSYRTGSGPHTGVHLIIVRDDLAYIIHDHPPVGPGGLIRQAVTLPAPGQYEVLVDIYPNIPGGLPNFQLSRRLDAGAYTPTPLPRYKPAVTVDGYHVDMRPHPSLHAIQAQFVDIDVTDSHGRRVSFMPWFGALAHAIFFHEGSLHYFHSHVCAPNAPNCGSLAGVGATRVTGQATSAGRLKIGVLLPEAGTWRLFLQMKLAGRIVTAPYTLTVLP
jgi:hypothetical protein